MLSLFVDDSHHGYKEINTSLGWCWGKRQLDSKERVFMDVLVNDGLKRMQGPY